jgi:TonB family protein
MGFWEQLVGQVVDEAFPLRECLGASEDSALFLTEFQDPDARTAVIRLLLADGQDANLRFSRWERAAKLSHPNLIRIFRLGRDQLDGVAVLYAVFEYGEENLASVLWDRPLTPVEARQMLEPTLSALAYLHGQGLVHGQVKPANIFAIGDQLKLSVDGVGPPTGEFSAAGDSWSLGTTLVEVLTQRLPEGLDEGKPIVPESLPEPFRDIARHCLKRDPEGRWRAAEIAARLQPKPVHAHRSFWNWRYLAPASVMLLLAIFALVSISRRPAAPIEQPTAPAVEKTIAPPTAPPPPSPRQSQQRSSPGEVVEQALPTVPPKTSNTIQGTVRVAVRVHVDSTGGVTSATLESRGPSKYFADLALQAARRWKFTPAKIDDRPVASEWVLRFEFLRTGPRVTAVPLTS